MVIVTQRGEIPCHRIVLMSQSLLVRKMFALMELPKDRPSVPFFFCEGVCVCVCVCVCECVCVCAPVYLYKLRRKKDPCKYT